MSSALCFCKQKDWNLWNRINGIPQNFLLFFEENSGNLCLWIHTLLVERLHLE